MSAYALRDGDDTILVDPLVAGEGARELAASLARPPKRGASLY